MENAMRNAALVVVTALLATAGTAQAASSPIASNYVDDFGSIESSRSPRDGTTVLLSHASPVPSNYIDDFGPVSPNMASSGTTVAVEQRASPIPDNYVDDFRAPAPPAAAPSTGTSVATAMGR